MTEASRGANGRQLPFTLDARQMRRREMGGPLSVARAVTDPRIMRNEPSHRRAHEPSARSDVAPRQAGDTASTVPCPRTAQSDPRGAEARGGAFPGPRPAGRSLSDTKRPPSGSCNSDIPREQVFCCICSSLPAWSYVRERFFLPLLGMTRQETRHISRDQGVQPAAGVSRAIRAPHHSTPVAASCGPLEDPAG